MKWPLDEADVAQRSGELRGRRISFQSAAVLGQHDEGEIGPGGLGGDPAYELAGIGVAHRLFGDDRAVGAAPDLLDQLTEVDTDFGVNERVAQTALCDDRIAPARREDQDAFGGDRGTFAQVVPISGVGWPTYVGTP